MAGQETAAVEMRSISKAFGGVRALREVSFLVRPGEVHALVGENGAGKSTLMKILQGVFQPDAGEIRLGGTPVRFANPLAARAAGIGMVFQEFSLVPTLTVAENICLCEEPVGSSGLIDGRGERLRAAKIFAEMGVDIDPTAPLWALSTALWQLTEIAKALSRNARILILDEPTASLAKHETEALFALIERLKSRGISIIYISHRMDEIYRIADRITILRDGALVLTSELGRLSPDAIIEAIAGREVTNALAWHPRSRAGATALLEVEGLSAGPRVKGVSLVLHEGEILGIAGLMGSGRTELVTALFGMLPIEAGTIRISGQQVRIARPTDAIGLGVVLIPEDRRVLGLVLEHSVNENLTLPLLSRVANKGVLVARKLRDVTRDLIGRFGIKVRDPGAPVNRLSGGNQQKVVIAKWLGTEFRILMMDEPTAGVDVGTKAEILSMVRAVAEEGKGVIFISSELPELLAVSDRILILSKGEVAGDLARADISSEDVLQLAIQGMLPKQHGARA